jgi:ABC-type sugar transport system ATPase subunit
MSAQRPILTIRNASKIYGGIHAIENVDFDLMPGEVHALVGENGAGKSTLCKAIAGAVRLSAGEYRLDGTPVTFDSPRDALRSGVAMVYQETSLVPTMTVAQNIELGHEVGLNRFAPLNARASTLLRELNFDVEPTATVSTLSSAQRQMVEIARAVHHKARVIVFDEPTASLTPFEIEGFFALIRRLQAQGVAIVYISHALEESLAISDRVTVLRDGRLVITAPTTDMTRGKLVTYMIGRDVSHTHYARASRPKNESKAASGNCVLSVENLSMGTIVRDMTFQVFGGEVVGMAGLIGSGRTETAKIIFGALHRDVAHGGEIKLRGRSVRYWSPKQAVDDGIVYLTEDRKLNGFFDTMTVDENLYLGRLSTRKGRRFLASRKESLSLGGSWIEKLKIALLSRGAKVNQLSGGNQQKVVIGKGLVQDPSVVIFDEPTRGVDVGAIPEIHRVIRELADDGKAVVVISSYLPEILNVSDRILVVRQGRVAAEMPAAEATEEAIMQAAMH